MASRKGYRRRPSTSSLLAVAAPCYYSTFLGSTVHALSVVSLQHTTSTSRRTWLQTSLTATTFIATNAIVVRADGSDQQQQQQQACTNGLLLPEQAVPGAYENPCMNLAVRQIPIRRHDDTTVVLEIQQKAAAAGSTGLAVWNSSLLLTRLLQGLDESFWTAHSTVLELGCGTGVASLAAATLGATRVIATDGNPAVVQLARQNLLANNNQGTYLQAQVLSWGLLPALDYSEFASLVIGSDLTYNPASWPLLSESMATILQPNGLALYLSLGHAGFNVQGEVDGFLSVAKSRGLVSVPPADPDFPWKIPPEQWLRQTCQSREEEIMLADNGVRVVILRKQSVHRLKPAKTTV